MATVKVTFTLDEAAIQRLNETASRLSKPKSQVVREAILDYHEKTDRLTETERQRMLRVVEELMARKSTSTQRDVNREIAEIRSVRRRGGRLHRAE